MVGFDCQKESESVTIVRKCHTCQELLTVRKSQKVSQLSESVRKCHNCQNVSQMSGIVRIVGWALAISGLTYTSFVIIPFNPKKYTDTFIMKLYKVSL